MVFHVERILIDSNLATPTIFPGKDSMQNLRIFIILAVLGVLFCITSANSLSVASNSERTSAICTSVSGQDQRTSRRRRWKFKKYSFRFSDQQGQEHSSTIQYGPFWLSPEVGESVPIVFAEGSPDSIYYDSVLHIWMFPILIGGIILVAGGKLFLFPSTKRTD